jgi:hypothetical protein
MLGLRSSRERARRAAFPFRYDVPDGTQARVKGAAATLRILVLVAGVALLAYGIWALWSIPRDATEFSYSSVSGTRWLWPLPFASMNGFTPQQLSSHLVRLLLLGPACLCFGAAATPWVARWPPWVPSRRALLAGCLVLSAAAFCLGSRGLPSQDDEPTYRMQADLLAHGHLADPRMGKSVEWANPWKEPYTIFAPAGMTGKYLFGEPLLLLPGTLLRFPLLGHFLLLLATLWFFDDAARRTGSERAARLSSVLLALSPAFLFTSVAAVSQVPALFGVTLAVWGLARRGWLGHIAAGTGLGLALAARVQVAFPCGLALVLAHRPIDRKAFVGMAVGAAPWLIAILAYDYAVMGNPFTLPWAGFGVERYGFGPPFAANSSSSSYVHTPAKALALFGVVLVRLNGWALGWPISLIGPIAWVWQGRPEWKMVRPWAWIALATVLFQAGYYSIGTSDTGALYHYLVVPFVVVTTALALLRFTETRWRAFAIGSTASFAIFGTATFFVEHGLRIRRLTDQITAAYAVPGVEAPAVVFRTVAPNATFAGWLSGVALRERWGSAPLVFYPASRASSDEALIALYPDRRCYYGLFERSSSAMRTIPCADLESTRPDLEQVATASEPSTLPNAHARPWFEDGGWKRAFPWLFR